MCVLPIYIWFSVFRNSVCAFRNWVRRVWSGFQAVCMLENGVIDWRCGGYVVGFLYILCFVRRNSFANVVFAVGDAAEVRFGVPKWLWIRGFAWWVAAVAGRSVGFIGCGIGFCCHVRAVSGRERGFAWWESGVFEVGLFCFRLKKRGGRLTTFPC